MAPNLGTRHACRRLRRFALAAGMAGWALCAVPPAGLSAEEREPAPRVYEPTWESLARHGSAPDWYEDAVFGIYFHWGVYSVAGMETRYMRDMYKPGHKFYEYHRKTYGDPKEFGYHDFIPMFRAEKWDPERWAELFKDSGADFAGSIGEHHDGFSMWDTRYNTFNAMKMGPRRDVVGEMTRALRKRGLKVVTTFHHLRWQWYDAGRSYCPKGVGVNDPAYADLYGPWHEPTDESAALRLVQDRIVESPVNLSEILPKDYLDNGYNKIIEVIDTYQPDQLQLDGGTCVRLGETRLKNMLAHYFNAAEKSGRQVAVSRGYDRNNPYVPSEIWGKEVMVSRVIPIECSIQNIECHFPKVSLTQVLPNKWQTSTPIPGFSWAYVASQEKKTPAQIEEGVNDLVDGIVGVRSKNGVTLVGVAPRADGTFPDAQVEILKKLGAWMRVNKEALHGSACRIPCAAGTLRFTQKGPVLYAIALEKPVVPVVIPVVTPRPGSAIRMLGSNRSLSWSRRGCDVIVDELPDPLPCDYAWVFRIERDEADGR